MAGLVQLFLLLILPAFVYSTCQFPDFVQANPDIPGSRWLYYIRDQNPPPIPTAVHMTVFVQGSMMMVKVKAGRRVRDPPPAFNRTCETKIGNKYFVTHKENGRLQFTCMEFIKRSTNVVQLKVAPLTSSADHSVCDEKNMLLDGWPLVEERDVREVYHHCPLINGYDIVRMFDKQRNSLVCESSFIKPRLESECMKGEGMIFSFPSRTCIPRGLKMQAKESVMCIATWDQDGYTFSVLRHTRFQRYWGFRFPSRQTLSGSIKAHLMKDVVLDTNPVINKTMNYIELDLESTALEDLCADAYTDCKDKASECADDAVAMHCPFTCKKCNPQTHPMYGTFPSNYHGRWLKTTSLYGNSSVNITENDISIQFFAKLKPIQLMGAVETGHYPVVATVTNGCRPRYACLNLKSVSDSVIQYRISPSHTWPRFSADGLCSEFRADPYPISDQYRSENMRNLVSLNPKKEMVACELPQWNYTVVTQFGNGGSCNGELVRSKCGSDTGFRLGLKNCHVSYYNSEYQCLASYNMGQFIVTVDKRMPGRFQCWNFPAEKQDMAMMLPSGDCDEDSQFKVSLGYAKADVSLTIQPRDEVCIVPLEDQSTTTKTTPVIVDETTKPQAISSTTKKSTTKKYEPKPDPKGSTSGSEITKLSLTLLISLVLFCLR